MSWCHDVIIRQKTHLIHFNTSQYWILFPVIGRCISWILTRALTWLIVLNISDWLWFWFWKKCVPDSSQSWQWGGCVVLTISEGSDVLNPAQRFRTKTSSESSTSNTCLCLCCPLVCGSDTSHSCLTSLNCSVVSCELAAETEEIHEGSLIFTLRIKYI